MHWLDTYYRRGRMGDPAPGNLNDYIGPSAADTASVPAAYQPTWVNPANKPLLDSKKLPAPKSDKMVPAAKKTTAKQAQQQDLLTVAGTLLGEIRAAGLKPPADYFCLYQMYHETNGFTSSLFQLHNNASGIKFAGQKGAVKQPTGIPYAWFDNWQNYMAAYRHELTKGADPGAATTLEDFAARLQKNGYYTDSYANYLAGLKRAQKALSGFTGGANSNAPYQKPENAFEKWWHGLSLMHKVEFGVGGAVVGLIIIKKIL